MHQENQFSHESFEQPQDAPAQQQSVLGSQQHLQPSQNVQPQEQPVQAQNIGSASDQIGDGHNAAAI